MELPTRRHLASKLRRKASQLIFAWGSVVSALCYAILTVLGEAPLIDDHLTITAISMLLGYLVVRAALHSWLSMAERLQDHS